MKKIKIIYFSLLIIISFFVSKIFFSYAFLTNKIEEHGKLNLIVGTLDYKLDSSDLHDNSISIPSGDTKIITLSIKSLNDISSKYELYYVLENDTDLVTVGFLEDSLNTKSDILEKFESKEFEVIIRNKSDSSQKIIFGVEGGLTNNDLVLSDNNSSLVDYCSNEDVYDFDYTGDEQNFTALCSGEYRLETWGAQGGTIINTLSNTTYQGGYGSYSIGNVSLDKNEILYINVGGSGASCLTYGTTILGTKTCGDDGGYNGGGSTRQYIANTFYGSGGGATHIATRTGLLKDLNDYNSNILIVSGGGGGASSYSNIAYAAHGGSAGGYIGSPSIVEKLDRNVTCTGGTQREAGTGSDTSGESFGQGGSLANYVGPGAGGGYYGGGTSEVLSCGGSGYIGNSSLTNKVMYCYDCDESEIVSTKTISTTNVSEEPVSNYAKSGNGYAKITYLGK